MTNYDDNLVSFAYKGVATYQEHNYWLLESEDHKGSMISRVNDPMFNMTKKDLVTSIAKGRKNPQYDINIEIQEDILLGDNRVCKRIKTTHKNNRLISKEIHCYIEVAESGVCSHLYLCSTKNLDDCYADQIISSLKANSALSNSTGGDIQPAYPAISDSSNSDNCVADSYSASVKQLEKLMQTFGPKSNKKKAGKIGRSKRQKGGRNENESALNLIPESLSYVKAIFIKLQKFPIDDLHEDNEEAFEIVHKGILDRFADLSHKEREEILHESIRQINELLIDDFWANSPLSYILGALIGASTYGFENHPMS